MENTDAKVENSETQAEENPEKPQEETETKPDKEVEAPTSTNAVEPKQPEPTQNGEAEPEKPAAPVEEKKVDEPAPEPTEDKPKTEPKTESEKVEARPVRTTRGTKRKAEAEEKNESTGDVANETASGEKENQESKDGEDAQKENELNDDDAIKSGNIMGKGKRARVPNKRYSEILLTPNRKSISSSVPSTPQSKTNPSEPEGEVETTEDKPSDNEVKKNPLPAIRSPGLPKKPGRSSLAKENLQDPKYLKPFKFGWRRELVWRSTSNSARRLGDIYYYTPTGKKVRSFREVSDHLINKTLSLDNFSFTKEPLGLNDPEKEIIRNAKIAKSDSLSDSGEPTKVESKKPKKFVSPNSSTPDTPKPALKPAAAVSPSSSSTPVATATTPATPGRARRAASAALPTVIHKEKLLKGSPKKGPATTPGKKPLQQQQKMAVKRGQSGPNNKTTTPAAKKSKLAVKGEESPKKPEGIIGKTRSSAVKHVPVAEPTPPPPPKVKKKQSINLKNITNTISDSEKNGAKSIENHMQNFSFLHNTLLHVFQYLKIEDLLRAGCVCTAWRDIANLSILWRTVRMKNSQVHSFEGMANALKKFNTVHLDLRKMLLPNAGDDIWPEFSRAIARVESLRKIELCRCPASVVEQLASTNPFLEVINAVTIKCESINLDPLKSLRCIRELRIKSTTGLNVNSIGSLKDLTTLRILSLTSINDLYKFDLSVIAELKNLESLDLGECSDFPKGFGNDVLLQLDKLEKLRLEKGQGNCHTFELLDAVKEMPNLEQLELVNFDVKTGFDKAIGGCRNIKKLMIIPTYISQSATTNNMVLSGVLRLQGCLSHFVWGVTLELLRVTELFVDQCEDSNKKEKKPSGTGDSIPVLKPVPDLSNGGAIQAASNPPQVEILPLPNLQKLLMNSLPGTRVKILKIPFHSTWRQTLTDCV